MKRASTFFLKAVIIVMAIAVTVMCAFLFPSLWKGVPLEWPQLTALARPTLISFYLTIIPFMIALYQAFRLLQYIDSNIAFSEQSVKALQSIKFCAIAMSALYMAGMPLAFMIADLDDAPGLIIISFAAACSPLVIATFAAVLQKLVRSAIDLKMENDLTI